MIPKSNDLLKKQILSIPLRTIPLQQRPSDDDLENLCVGDFVEVIPESGGLRMWIRILSVVNDSIVGAVDAIYNSAHANRGSVVDFYLNASFDNVHGIMKNGKEL